MTFYNHLLHRNFTFTREFRPGAPCHDYLRTHKKCQKFPLDSREPARRAHNYHKLCYQIRDVPEWDQYGFDPHKRLAKMDRAYGTQQPVITEEIENLCGPECRDRLGMEEYGG